MRLTLILILREYLSYVRRKSFLLMTALVPLLSIGMMAVQIYMARRETAKVFAIADHSGMNIPMRLWLDRNLQPEVLFGGRARYEFDNVGRSEDAAAKAIEQVKSGGFDAFIRIPKDIAEGGKVEYHSRRITDFTTQEWLEARITDIVIRSRLTSRGIARGDLEKVLANVRLDLKDVTGREQGARQRTLIGFASFFMLYMMIAIYGSMIMNGFVEDKMSKVMEVMLSIAKPRDILLGKVLGVLLTSLTQVALWVLIIYGAAHFRPEMMILLKGAPKAMLAWALLYFLLGYLVYALMMAAAGSLCQTLQDAQQAVLPIMLPILGTMTMMPAVLREPDGTIALVLSLVPLTSPVAMPAMLGMADIPAWQIAASLASLGVFLAFLSWGSSKIFRLSILSSGGKPSIRTIMALLRTREA
jgi:ABC-2 type transport system permease protein